MNGWGAYNVVADSRDITKQYAIFAYSSGGTYEVGAHDRIVERDGCV